MRQALSVDCDNARRAMVSDIPCPQERLPGLGLSLAPPCHRPLAAASTVLELMNGLESSLRSHLRVVVVSTLDGSFDVSDSLFKCKSSSRRGIGALDVDRQAGPGAGDGTDADEGNATSASLADDDTFRRRQSSSAMRAHRFVIHAASLPDSLSHSPTRASSSARRQPRLARRCERERAVIAGARPPMRGATNSALAVSSARVSAAKSAMRFSMASRSWGMSDMRRGYATARLRVPSVATPPCGPTPTYPHNGG